jgi:hypothetical protein
VTRPDHGLLLGLTDDDHLQYWNDVRGDAKVDVHAAIDDVHHVMILMTDWTPSYTNLTVGNGTVVARYQQVGNLVTCWFHFVLGSTSSVGNVRISPPVAFSSEYSDANNVLGNARFKAGAFVYQGHVRTNGADDFRLDTWDITGTYPEQVAISATIPNTWAESNVLFFTATYEVA